MKKYITSRSLKYYVMLSLILIILLQTSVFAGFLITSGMPTDMNENTFKILDRTVSTSAFSLEEYFGGFVNLTDFYVAVSDRTQENASALDMSISAYLNDSENRNQLLTDITPDILTAMRTSSTSACFVILEGGSNGTTHDAVWLTDQNPYNTPKNNSDIYVAVGPTRLLYDYALTLDSLWSQTIETDTAYPFYQTVIDSVAAYPELSAYDLGYFSVSNVIHEEEIHGLDKNCIFYCVPLIDDHHKPYGVIGFGVSFNYLKSRLPDQNLLIDTYGTYLLGITETMSRISSVYVGNDDYYPTLKSGQRISLSVRDAKYGIYDINDKSLPSSTSVCMKPLRLYTEQSPYYKQQWVLCGVVGTDTLYAPSDHLKLVLIGAVSVSLLLAVVGTFFITHFFMRPIRMLNRSIPKLSPGNSSLPWTKISEFDALADAIKKQNDYIYRVGNKMSEIIDFANISLAVCEFVDDDEMIYCTHRLFEILELSDEGWELNHILKPVLKGKLKKIEEFFEPSRETADLFRYHRPDYEDKWLDIKQRSTGKNTLVIISDVTPSILEKQKILHDRDYDALTGLYNRGAFAREMRYLIDEGHCTNGLLSIWDLDSLKYTNDTYGHEVGDRYICTLADLLKRRMPEKSISARLAGDEFTMFLYDEPKETMIATLKAIHAELMQETLLLPDGLELNMSASAGMAFYAEDGTNYPDLLKYADFAMYEVKKSSKGSIKAYNKERYLRDYILVQGVGELNRLIKYESIKYVFQPIFSLKNGTIFAYEALMRPISDLLRKPEELLRVAQAEAKLDKIERITWFHALKDFFNQVREDDNARVFINSIPNQLLAADEWTLIEKMYEDKLSRVVMEITENTKSELEIDSIKRAFCAKWNIPIALDDYGSGYSNSDMLVSFDFHFVKLDMTLIRDIHKNPSTQSLVRGMIAYCHENYIMVIAEGIETVEEYETAKELGADFGQGFYLAKPSISLYSQE